MADIPPDLHGVNRKEMNKTGIIFLAEGHQREDVYKARRPAELRENEMIRQRLRPYVQIVEADGEDVRGKRELLAAMKKFAAEEVDAVLISVPTFVQASVAAMAVRLSPVPCAVIGNNQRDTYAQVGFMASVGAIEQAGLPYLRITEDIREDAAVDKLRTFFDACHAIRELKGLTYGMFGGRSLGISTGTADTAQWMRKFGIDIEQIDQFQIVRYAEKMPAEDVQKAMQWVREKYGRLTYKEGKFDDSALEKMVRSYLAVRQLIEENELDFVGIKCQPDMSNGYALQCLTIQLLNDPYDPDGEKKPVPCSCEADSDGALTMQVLNLISGGKPTALQDIFFYDEDQVVLANCGGSASYFAKGSENAEENLKEVYLIPHGFGEAGGAATQFCFAPGTYTYARLFRKDREYCMALSLGEVQPIQREDLEKYVWYRPTSVVKGIDAKRFAAEFGCNHVHCVRGDHTKAVEQFCRLLEIPVIRMDRK